MKGRLAAGRQSNDMARGFAVIAYEEKLGWQVAGAADAMARLLEDSTASDDAIKSACSVSGWSEDRVRYAMVSARQPTADSQRKGKFGEVIHAAVLEEFCGMLIAVKKHRYNPAPNASPHGVDLIALHGSDNGTNGGEYIVYVETKLRTAYDPNVLRDSYGSLVKACKDDIPARLAAELDRLHESNIELFCRVAKALFGRQRPRLRVGLVVESSQWRDSDLDRLAKSVGSGAKGRLSVDIMEIGQLGGLVDESYARVGSVA